MLERKLSALDQQLRGRLGVCVEWLPTGERWGLRADERFPTASVIKVPILAALYAKARDAELNLQQKLTLKRRDQVGGSGILRYLSPGLEISLQDLAALMTILSDNTATNMLIDFLGLGEINRYIRAWGYENTILWRKVNFRYEKLGSHWLGESTPQETTDLLSRIARRKLSGRRYDRLMEEVLANQEYDSAIPRYLPGSGLWTDGGTSGKKPPFVIAHKTGALRGCRIDAGIVTSPIGRYVISVYVKGLRDHRYHVDNEGTLVIAEVSRMVYAFLRKKYAG